MNALTDAQVKYIYFRNVLSTNNNHLQILVYIYPSINVSFYLEFIFYKINFITKYLFYLADTCELKKDSKYKVLNSKSKSVSNTVKSKLFITNV